jgi:hypothetical protein
MTDKVWRLARIERLALALAQSQDGDHRAQCAAEIEDEWAAIAAMEAGTERPEAGPTVRVKVALVVDEEGRWGAAGGHEFTGVGWQWLANEENVCGSRRNCLFIEADVPLPAAPAVIKGGVTEE